MLLLIAFKLPELKVETHGAMQVAILAVATGGSLQVFASCCITSKVSGIISIQPQAVCALQSHQSQLIIAPRRRQVVLLVIVSAAASCNSACAADCRFFGACSVLQYSCSCVIPTLHKATSTISFFNRAVCKLNRKLLPCVCKWNQLHAL